MILFIIFSIIILIFFFPIPLKIRIEYYDKNLSFKVYKYTIYSSNNGIENELFKKIIKKKSKINKNKNIQEKKINKKKISFKKLYKNLSSNKIKPKLKLTCNLNYGLEDAALCAMLYGVLCNIPNILYLILSIVFKVKFLNLDIKPNFEKFTFSIGISSIFYFNIANIIYILILLIKSMEIKEVTPN